MFRAGVRTIRSRSRFISSRNAAAIRLAADDTHCSVIGPWALIVALSSRYLPSELVRHAVDAIQGV